MRYDHYEYLWPPRPESKIPANLLGFYEKRGYWAQVKKNGTCTVIFARGTEVIFKTRHNDDHKMWTPLPEHKRFFQSDSLEWNVFVAELIHSKTPHIKNQLYIFDQLVKNGVHLVGTTYEERQIELATRWETADEGDQLRVVVDGKAHPYVSVAKNFKSGFARLYKDIIPRDGELKENEGLVLKNPKAKLTACLRPTANSSWQVKCRVPHKNYSF